MSSSEAQSAARRAASNPPLRHESIRREPAVQRAAREPVDVLLVFLDDHAELREVQVRIQSEERIVGPFDEIDAERQCAVTLHELQLAAQSGAAIRRQDAQHVRPMGERSAVDGWNRIHESHHRLAVERTDQDRAAVHGRPPAPGSARHRRRSCTPRCASRARRPARGPHRLVRSRNSVIGDSA